MNNRISRAGFLGAVALVAAFAATAATIQSPVKPAASPLAAARLAGPGQEGLDFDASALSALRGAGTGSHSIAGFPVGPGVTGTVVLERFEVLARDARVTVSGLDGESSRPFPSISHFSGHIEGDPDSAVYVSAQANKLVAYVRTAAGTSYVGPDESNSDYVVRAADSSLNERQISQTFSCAVEDLPAALTGNAEPSYPAPQEAMAALKQGTVRVETDWELLTKFPVAGMPGVYDVDALASWVVTLYGAINVVYERDLSLHLALSEVHTWTGGAAADPYASGTTRIQLDEVGDWWHANRPMASYPRSIVHFLSGKTVQGGIAWLSVLCSGDFSSGGGHYGGAYGVTQVYGTYPLQNWDQFATSHETGHNAGSHHTHCYSPPIDHCYSGESGCYTGPTSSPGLGLGTIMSYCHFFGWSAVSFEFHQRCIDEQLMPHINGASCLTAASTFVDVPPAHMFFDYVETIAALGITSGCGGAYYCPDAAVTRAQMAVFLLKANLGSAHVPPPATGTVFADVNTNTFAAAWIEELASLGITIGCGGGNYCPAAPVTRRQMAAFLLKTKFGSGHVPPNPNGVFADVPMNDGFASWIEELYTSAITGGCLANPLRYCPDGPNTRGQMAVFLVKTFDLVHP